MRNSISLRIAPGLVAVSLAIAAIVFPARADQQFLTGVNVAGAEFNSKKLPGTAGTDYFYPKASTIDHFAAAGMNVVRLPFRWERIQQQLNGELDAAEYRRLADAVQMVTSKNMIVILDVHNYAAYRNQTIGSTAVPVSAFADLWKRLAEKFKGEPLVAFGLMNEPKGLATETWLEAANAAIAQIRQAGARNLVLVPGNGWTGAHSWFHKGYGTPNATVMLGVKDPADNYAYELHQYLDSDFSGTHPECRNEQIGVTTLTEVTEWLRHNNKRGFLGEFGAGRNDVCLAALENMLTFIDKNRDAWLGWTYWAAGAWPTSYFTSVQPHDGVDRPQMSVLLRYVTPTIGRSSQ